MDMAALLNLIAELPEEEVPVLATVVRVNGHAYRKQGAAMLFLPGGGRAGSVSAGCLEDDLQARAAGVAESGKPACAAYNLRSEEDAVWGESMGCGGEIMVLLEAVAGELRQLLGLAGLYLAKGIETTLERKWGEAAVAYTLRNGSDVIASAGTVGVLGSCGRELADARPNAARPDAAERADRLRLAVKIAPKPRLVLFGDGEDARAIADIAEGIGFRAVTADWRESRRGRADAVGTPAELVDALRLGAGDYLMLCSHRLDVERRLLELVLPLGLRYIGIIGSRTRIRMLFEGLERTPNVHAPAGLPLPADGPREIAVSVAAQLIEERHASADSNEERKMRHENRRDLFGGRLQPANG
ncbi:xanthine dehydrogenase accessory factor [Paenibacillus sp. UNC496MF]|uniref:XdhC family protein n=1 Tax=Paenibacillus sp. UNC496MF TaxID=1502753 RepID=UPI0008E34659|nr:XdhC family protein [Paenibacillus sp. UNC496MF]SFI33123.1 xanthine dehydrogenase accessory factor [Paenibacillus sp. UNC496MF]